MSRRTLTKPEQTIKDYLAERDNALTDLARLRAERDEWLDLARRLALAVADAHEYGLDGRVGEMMVRLGDLLDGEDCTRAAPMPARGGTEGE